MQKKKIVVLVLGVAAIIGLALWAMNLNDNADRSSTELIEFNIEDTNSINKIIITEPNGLKFEIHREGTNDWTDKDGNCIIQQHTHHILEAAHNIEFKGYVTENSKGQHLKMLSTLSTKVEFFQDGKWSKTWYLGTSTPDHYGQVMLLEIADEGKSDLPVLMKVKAFNGIIDPRFFSDPRKWQCTQIFTLSNNQIKSVEYKNNEDPERSFSVSKDGFQFEVKQNGRLLPSLDTVKVFNYLNRYKKVHYELPNYVLTNFQIDSLKKTTPMSTIKVTETSGKTSLLNCYKITGPEAEVNEFGVVANYDKNRFWCELPSGQLVKCQYFVFDPLFRGDLYFRMDKSKFITGFK
jgi:hypothetical protein